MMLAQKTAILKEKGAFGEAAFERCSRTLTSSLSFLIGGSVLLDI